MRNAKERILLVGSTSDAETKDQAAYGPTNRAFNYWPRYNPRGLCSL
jgi:hypothetical protein